MKDKDSLYSCNTPQVSVIVPVFNAGPYIEEAIRSVIKQSFSEWELIIVDDGSTDDTHERAKPFLSDSRLRYQWQENGGPSSARNRGISLAKADLIAFLDADDYWLPSKLEKQLQILNRYPNIGVCGTGRIHVSPDGKEKQHCAVKEFHGKPFPSLLFAPLADMSMAVIRRSVFNIAGIFDESLLLSEDYEFWLRVGKYAEFHVIPEPLVYIRQGHVSTSGSWKRRRAYFHEYILPKFLDEYGGRQYVKPWHIWKLRARRFKYEGDESPNYLARFGWYTRAILAYPFDTDTYSALATLVIPKQVFSMLNLCDIKGDSHDSLRDDVQEEL